ncbi:MAG: hypothetical protein Q9M08_00880 [Mariprofundus sp.]|nr:hypothetical protein [Mariprofundus sp.]
MKQLGIIAALPAEAKCLAGYTDKKNSHFTHTVASPLQIADNVLLIISGIGEEQATTAATALLDHGVNALLSWGCAGALSAQLQPGDLLLPRSIQTQTSISFDTDRAWQARLSRTLAVRCNPCSDALVTSTDIITASSQKQVLNQSSGAVAVDMESAAIAMVAQKAGVPFMVIRAIADDVNTAIPANIAMVMDKFGNISYARMLSLLLLHPALWLHLIRLGRQFSAAKSTLSLAATTLTPDLLAFSNQTDP